MDAQVTNLKRREFLWGHSMGIATLTAAGAFWLVVAARSLSATWAPGDRSPQHVSVVALSGWVAVILVPTAVLFAGAARVRRRADGFSRHDLRRPEVADGVRARQRGWYFSSVAELVGCALSGWLGTRFGRPDLVLPGIALVVSLHFAPFGRTYALTSILGTLIAVATLLVPDGLLPPASRSVFLGVGMGMAAWSTAAYLALSADRLAHRYAEGR